MKLHQTDNDKRYLAIKVKLRQQVIDQIPAPIVLECYAGDGVIWGQLKKDNPGKEIKVLRIDAKEDKAGIYLKGDNMKFLKSIELGEFNFIDLDAYGIPYKQLKLLFDRKFQGWVAVTFIQTMTGQLPKAFLSDLGFTEKMVKKCPSLFNKNGLDKLKAWLGQKGVKTIQYFAENRKNYLVFEIKKP